MKKVLNNAIAIILGIVACTANTNAENPSAEHPETALVGLWETYKITPNQKDYASSVKTIYCNFKQDGTYEVYTEYGSDVQVIGSGRWFVRNNQIALKRFDESSDFLDYVIEENALSIGNKVTYYRSVATTALNASGK